jgi:DNA-binding response OmpR family regulator
VKTILVVDDEQPIRELLTLILEGEGYEVACAADGYEALRLANRRRHDAIILDLKMPGMDGTEFAKRYRATGGHAPIVVITAARGEEEKAAEVDLCGYLAKPFELQALLDSVRACAPLPSAAR